MNIVFIVLVSMIGCTKKNMEGTVLSLPVTFSLNDALDGTIDKTIFSGNIIEVELSDGEIIEAFATTEQMEEILKGKHHVTLEKTKDDTSDGAEWKVIKVEEIQEQQDQ